MFSSSQFEATIAFSGGGSMSSQPSNLNNSSPAPSKGLVPVTVKQISEASQSGNEKSTFVINGVDLNNVTLVGLVLEKLGGNTDVNFVWMMEQDESNVEDGGTNHFCKSFVCDIFQYSCQSAPNGSQAQSSNPGYAQYSVDGLKNCDKLVIDYLQQDSDMSDELGIHVNELSRELKLPLDNIMLSLKTLGDDGLVYSTIDDYHYRQA